MTIMEPLSPDEVIESVTLSPLAKYLLVGLAGAVCGVVIGLGVSALLADVRSETPHVPTRVRVEREVEPEAVAHEEKAISTEDPGNHTPPSTEELAAELGIDLTKDS